MLDTIWQRLDSGTRMALPFVTALLCTLLGVIAWPLPWFGAVAPPLALMAVYYWAIHRPDLFRPGMAFVIGLLHDTINGLPLGLSALLFVAAYDNTDFPAATVFCWPFLFHDVVGVCLDGTDRHGIRMAAARHSCLASLCQFYQS